jgi:hypothetical protein
VSVAQLRPPVLTGAVAAARAAVTDAGRVPVATVSTAGLGEAIGELAGLESQVDALRMALSAEADARGVARETAETGTDAWLARLTGDPREVLAGACGSPRRSRRPTTRPGTRSPPAGSGPARSG